MYMFIIFALFLIDGFDPFFEVNLSTVWSSFDRNIVEEIASSCPWYLVFAVFIHCIVTIWHIKDGIDLQYEFPPHLRPFLVSTVLVEYCF